MFNEMITAAMVMYFILLVLYVYAYVRVNTGSGIKDVKKITMLLIVSTAAGVISISMGFAIEHMPQEYFGFSTEYIET